MKNIKFGFDFEKLPKIWENTQATLIAVYPESLETIQNKFTAFWNYDTKERNKETYFNVKFKDALILVFIHQNTGRLIPTIRNNTNDNFNLYINSIGETFKFIKNYKEQ